MNRTKLTAGLLAALAVTGSGAAVAGAATGAQQTAPATRSQTAPDKPTPGDVRDTGTVDKATPGDVRDTGTVDKATPGDVRDTGAGTGAEDATSGAADTDNVQSGDRSGADRGTDQGSEVAGADGPAGHADEAGMAR